MNRYPQGPSGVPLRVAYFAGSMQPGQDGVTRVLYRLADALVERKIPNLFFSPLIPPEDERPTRMVGVPSIQFPLYRAYRIALPGYKSFEREIQEFAPDILHIHSPCSLGYAAVRFGKKAGIPVVATYHTHFPSYAKYYRATPFTGIAWNYLRSLYNSCERVYAPSEPIVRELSHQGVLNLRFLPHGVDTRAFHPKYRSREWREHLGIQRKHVLLFVGRLVWEKDVRTLAQAYRLLQLRRDDTALVFVGDGPARAELQQLLPDSLFLGYQSGAALSTAFASSDILVMPSTTETFGNVTIEAMASGLVPVCAAEGGASGLVQPGITGLLSRPRDPGDLMEKILLLLTESGRRAAIADQALQFARQQTWESIFDDLFLDYEGVLRSYHTRRQRALRKAA